MNETFPVCIGGTGPFSGGDGLAIGGGSGG